MKYPLILMFASMALINRSSAQTQSTDEFSYFNSNWKPAKEKHATYLLRVSKIGDSVYQYSYYNMYGPLVRVETWADRKGAVQHGLFAWYDAQGGLDSAGYLDHGIRDREWVFTNGKGKIDATFYYEKGRLLSKKEAEARREAEKVRDPSLPDLTRESPESSFLGGPQGWLKFLTGNMKYPDRAVNNEVKGTAILLFRVGTTGAISDVMMFHSVEMSIDDEAKRIMRVSPPWVPAINGEFRVPSYKFQPLVFALTVDKG